MRADSSPEPSSPEVSLSSCQHDGNPRVSSQAHSRNFSSSLSVLLKRQLLPFSLLSFPFFFSFSPPLEKKTSVHGRGFRKSSELSGEAVDSPKHLTNSSYHRGVQ